MYALTNVRKFFPNVKTVKNATGPVTIEVTPRDVANSKRKRHSECAMATACKRAMHLDGVIVSIHTAFLIKGEVATRYKVSSPVSREVVSYDRGSGFAPGEYRLHVPHYRNGKARGPHKTAGRKRKAYHLTTGIRTILGSQEVS
jgi:hypothetical protein